jgi:hypothetical protein
MKKINYRRKVKAFMRRNGITKDRLFIWLVMLLFTLIMFYAFFYHNSVNKTEIETSQDKKIDFLEPTTIEKEKDDVTPPVVKDTMPVVENLSFEQKAFLVYYSRHPEFIDHIWYRETGRGGAPEGHHMYCNKQGKSNEFGYAVFDKLCFDTFSESIMALEAWVSKHSDLTFNQALCLYNTGKVQDTCAYLGHDFSAMN